MGHILLAVRTNSLPPPFKVIYHILAAILAVVYVECRRVKKNHLVHFLIVHFMLHCLSLLYLSPLPVDITLQAVPAAPISLVTITVAIMMF